jgi:hypothetical protein
MGIIRKMRGRPIPSVDVLKIKELYSREISRIPVALAAGGMRKLNNPCYNIIHTETINTFV